MDIGFSASAGFDPRTLTAAAKINDGMILTDVSRENSEWIIEVDSEAGLVYDKNTGSVKGIKRIHRRLGPQITGYLVELAEKDPESARTYLKAVEQYWSSESK
jgi:hypothetical protein